MTDDDRINVINYQTALKTFDNSVDFWLITSEFQCTHYRKCHRSSTIIAFLDSVFLQYTSATNLDRYTIRQTSSARTMACRPSSADDAQDPIKENYDNYLLIDVGSNMVNKKFTRDLESVLQRAKDSGEYGVCFPFRRMRPISFDVPLRTIASVVLSNKRTKIIDISKNSRWALQIGATRHQYEIFFSYDLYDIPRAPIRNRPILKSFSLDCRKLHC